MYIVFFLNQTQILDSTHENFFRGNLRKRQTSNLQAFARIYDALRPHFRLFNPTSERHHYGIPSDFREVITRR